MTIEAFGVRNLRCLSDTGLVPIRPITVLVGRNSSGKSTFLRAFPLLRQSVETGRNSPILWYHKRYVDFGSLVDAASHQGADSTVTFLFKLRLPSWTPELSTIIMGDPLVEIAMTLAGQETPYVSRYEIRVAGHVIEWELDGHGQLTKLVANDRTISFDNSLALGGHAHLMPALCVGETSTVSFHQSPLAVDSDDLEFDTDAQSELLTSLAKCLLPLFHGNASTDSIVGTAALMPIGSPKDMLSRLATISNQKRFKESVAELDVDDDEFQSIAAAIAAYRSPYIIELADHVLARLMGRVAYLKPLRVNPERAYRIQNLSVDEVEPDGENLPMFLRSLSSAEMQSFAEFTEVALGFEPSVRVTGLHAEILIKEGQAQRFVNLVDVGFGYSEVLPLAAVLWATCIRPGMHKRPAVPIVTIEQPELHLHPAAQSKLARMFAEAVRRSDGSKIIVETHSESLINGLGKLISEGVLSADDVQIALFDKDDATGETEVSLAGYRPDGALYDWPYGFLSPIGERRVPSSSNSED